MIVCNYWVNQSTSKYVYDEISNIPYRENAIVLGTSKFRNDGTQNHFFEFRIRATVQLYKAKKIKNIIVSGDNSTKNYDEPDMMKKELMKRGVPECSITCDYAGFRTYDSMIRLKKVFGINKCVVVSQKFHNQRALFIARNNGINAIGFNAKDVEGTNGFKTHVREYFARMKAVVDVYLWSPGVKFLGKKESLNSCSDTLIFGY